MPQFAAVSESERLSDFALEKIRRLSNFPKLRVRNLAYDEIRNPSKKLKLSAEVGLDLGSDDKPFEP